MPAKSFTCCRDGKELTFEQALECGRGNSHTGQSCLYPFEMIQGMISGSDRATAHISATMLTGCRRRSRLQMEENFSIDPRQSYAAMRGTAGHSLMEQWGDPGCVYEKRFEIIFPEYPDKPFTGQIDKIDIEKKKIVDFKTKKDRGIPKNPDPDHVMQLNCYRYLVKYGYPQTGFAWQGPNSKGLWTWYPKGKPANIEITSMELVYWSMEKVVILPAEILPEEEVKDFILDGMYEMLDKDLPPVPTDLDPFHGVLCTQYCSVNQQCVANLLKKRT